MTEAVTAPVTNWARNIVFGADRLEQPSSVQQLQDLVASSRQVRVLGTGHSFNRIADTADTLLSVAALPPVLELDEASGTVTVSAGLRFGEIAAGLQARGFALHNLGSLPHISVAGACATGTHGGGDRNGTLASAVRAMELVGADGELVSLTRDDPDFDGTVIALGALGVVTRLTLAVVPTFDICQVVYDDLPLARVASDLEEILGAAYSVSVFTDWSGQGAQVWLKARADEHTSAPAQWLGGSLADGPRHPVPGMPPEFTTQQLGVPGPWHERLPHFRMEFTPSSGEELQSEYFLPRPAAVAAVEALTGLGEVLAPVLQTSEIRTIAAEDLWLSPSQGRETVAFHFTWHPDAAAVARAVAALEEVLMPLGARPHWAKVFRTDPATVRERYERSAEFPRLLQRFDPKGRFRNEYIDRYFSR